MAGSLLATQCGRVPYWQRFVHPIGYDVRLGPRVAARGRLPRHTELSVLDLLERMFVIVFLAELIDARYPSPTLACSSEILS